MKKWEYKKEILGGYTISECEIIEKMDSLGKLGWELVAIAPETRDWFEIAYFKREIKK
jgi:hypothetical protein